MSVSTIKQWLKTNYGKVAIAGVLLLSLVIFALISLVNHNLFRTYCLDLGYYTQCMWDYAHGRINQSILFENNPKPCLAAHFDLYLVLFSPLIYIFGSYTLLILQIVFLLIGCFGMYKLLQLYTDNQIIPIIAALSFSLFFGTLHAVAFDYHPDVIIAATLPWFFYVFKKKRYIVAGLLLLFILIGKENTGLLMIFVSIGLMWEVRKDKKALLVLLGYLIFSILYTFLILQLVMPSLDHGSQSGVYGGLYRYKDWGYSSLEILKNILTQPLKALGALFDHETKLEFWKCLLLSGAVIAIGKPNYLFMIIPLVAQKMLSFDPELWNFSNHYNIIFAPIIITACYLTLLKFSKKQVTNTLSIVALLMALYGSYFATGGMGTQKTWFRRQNVAFYNEIHYKHPEFPIKKAQEMIEMIPENASVCASSCFCPHLCFRDSIYVFPHNQMTETEYVLVTREWPEQDLSIFQQGYDTVAAANNLTLLRKQ